MKTLPEFDAEKVAKYQRDIFDLRQEVEHWRKVSIELAEFHAANMYIGLKSAASKYDRSRLLSIMEKSKALLQGTVRPHLPGHDHSVEGQTARVVQRLSESLASLGAHAREVNAKKKGKGS